MAKPYVCELCGKPHKAEKKAIPGDWVNFANYRAPTEIMIGHPEGDVYFCDDHIEAARLLSALTDQEALAKLRATLHIIHWQAPPAMPWWKKLFRKN
jgi:hypothetical protein